MLPLSRTSLLLCPRSCMRSELLLLCFLPCFCCFSSLWCFLSNQQCMQYLNPYVLIWGISAHRNLKMLKQTTHEGSIHPLRFTIPVRNRKQYLYLQWHLAKSLGETLCRPKYFLFCGAKPQICQWWISDGAASEGKGKMHTEQDFPAVTLIPSYLYSHKGMHTAETGRTAHLGNCFI